MQKKSLIKTTLVLFLFCASFWLNAQQDPQYTQYMFNTMSVNPAYTGSRGAFSTNLLYRSQWVGLTGAPETKTFNFHTPLGVTESTGIGLSIVDDRIGPAVQTYFDIDFSYTIYIAATGKLSFGLKAGGNLLDVNFNELDLDDGTDTVFQNNIDNRFSPDLGVGLYYHTDSFYVGLSAPSLIETTFFDSAAISESAERINYYLIAGYVFELNPTLMFKPAVLTKAVSGAPVGVDLSANFLINNKFMLGAAYRLDAAVSALAGFQISDQFFAGFAYDAETSDLGNTMFNSGSFEVFLRFEIQKQQKKFSTPRFF